MLWVGQVRFCGVHRGRGGFWGFLGSWVSGGSVSWDEVNVEVGRFVLVRWIKEVGYV